MDSADLENSQSLLRNLILDVLVTRNWVAHDKLSVVDVKRCMQSLALVLQMLNCEPASLKSVCGIIDNCIQKVDRAQTIPAFLSIDSFVRLLFMRYCWKFCSSNEQLDFERAIEAMPHGSQYHHLKRIIVLKFWRAINHSKSSSNCMSGIVALCALSSVLHHLGSAHAVAADSCDADVLQLLVRIQLFDQAVLLKAVSDCHQIM